MGNFNLTLVENKFCGLYLEIVLIIFLNRLMTLLKLTRKAPRCALMVVAYYVKVTSNTFHPNSTQCTPLLHINNYLVAMEKTPSPILTCSISKCKPPNAITPCEFQWEWLTPPIVTICSHYKINNNGLLDSKWFSVGFENPQIKTTLSTQIWLQWHISFLTFQRYIPTLAVLCSLGHEQ